MLAYGTITISDEMRGSGIYKITTAPSSYTTTTGGFTPTYRIALATVKSQAGVTEVLIGDILEYSYYHYPVGYVDGSYVYLGPRVSFRGATGASATAYSLIVSHAAIVKAEDGTFTPGEITLTAKSQTGTAAMSNYTGRLVVETTTDNSTWTNRYNQDAATYTYTIPSGIVAVRCSLYVAGGTATLLDQQIIPVVSDGGKGEDAYTVILTNENHTFAGGTSAALAGSTTCNVVAYKGAEQVAATIGTISGAPTGMSTTITSNGTTSAYFTVTVTTSMVTKNGVLTVPVTVDGKSFSMKFSYSLALAGTSVTISSITYATSTTETQPADSEFTATTAPTVAEGNWLWTKVTFSNGSSVYTKSKQGKSGTNGTSYYTFIRYSTSADGNPMVETPTDDTLYIGIYTGTSSTAPTGYGSYTWSRYTGKDGKMLYGTCSTTASTAAKSVACADAKELYSGLTIMITFSTANTAAAPTLNVNSLGAKNIYFDGANASSSNLFLWGTGASIQFTYNGTAWVPVGHPCTYYGTCTTAAGTAAKVSTINQVVVCKGTTVNLQMTNATAVASATLNISSTGAKTIYANGAVLSADSPYNWIAGSTTAFTFDGTYWRLGDTSSSSKAADAQTAASAAQTTADTALTSANGKNKVYHQASQPSGGTYVTGDTWFDTDDGYKMYTYNGSSWVAEEFGTNAISDLAITNAKIADATIQNAKIATVDAGKITTGVLDAARINAGSITIGKLDTSTQTSIANGDAAKTAIDNLKIGGRNLARNTGAMTASDWVLQRATVADSVLTMTPTTSSANAKYKIDYLPYGIYKNNEFTISFDCREVETGSYGSGPVRVCFMVQLASQVNSLVTAGSDRYQTFNLESQGTDWHRYSITKKIPDEITLGQESALVDSSYVSFQFVRNASTRPIEIKNIKFELGNIATDWTPAPEDTQADIDTAQTTANTANNRNVACRGTCATEAGEAAKVVASTGFALTAGATVTVYCSVANTSAAALTLNVNSTGVKNVWVGGAATSASNQLLWAAGATMTFVYDGTQFRLESKPGILYGSTCGVAAGTEEKTTTVDEIVLYKGVTIYIPMTYENTNTSATLNVTSLGAKPIYYNTTSTRPTTANHFGWIAGRTVAFQFDGANFRLVETATIIDGGHIQTGTIDASQVDVTNLKADNIVSGLLSASGGKTFFDLDNGYFAITSYSNKYRIVLRGWSAAIFLQYRSSTSLDWNDSVEMGADTTDTYVIAEWWGTSSGSSSIAIPTYNIGNYQDARAFAYSNSENKTVLNADYINVQGWGIKPLSFTEYTISSMRLTYHTSGGAYRGQDADVITPSMIGIPDGTIISVLVIGWDTLAANIMPYLNSSGAINFMSDISQTIGNVKIRVIYSPSHYA